MHYIKSIVCLLLLATLSGCSYIYGENSVIINRDTDYLKATSIPPLKIPPGLSSSTISTQYPTSERIYPKNYLHPSLVPPELTPAKK